jgi:pyruvate dehydrogenase E2 component (dihydrolipoamide acetyltransferase)
MFFWSVIMPIEVVMPALGLTVENGIILEWLKQEGDTVKKGESIFAVEADKATTEVESPASGILTKILVPIDIEIPILTVLALITEPGENILDEQKETDGKSINTDSTLVNLPGKESIISAVPAARKLAKNHDIDLSKIQGSGPDGIILLRDVKSTISIEQEKQKINISPLARRIAEEESVSIDSIEGSGIRGRIMRADIEATLEKSESETPVLGSVIPMSNVRKIIASRIEQSAFTAPHNYFFTEVWLDPLLDYREKIRPDFESNFGKHLSINDFLIKAVALNIQKFPMLNAQIHDKQIHILPNINIGIAVSISDGLIVPVIENADKLGLAEISRQRDDLIHRARDGKLKLREIENGTFTISSLAQYDITHFTATLNPPQSGILSIGKMNEKLVMIDDCVISKQIICIGLSVDHRIIDGVMAAKFLQNLKHQLEKPSYTYCNF